MTTFRAWYADAQRMDSRRKWVIFSDRGQASVAPGAISFQGSRVSLASTEVEAVDIVRAKVAHWTGLVYVAAAAVFVTAVVSMMPPTRAWSTAVAAILIGAVAGIISWVQQVFIRIAGVDEQGRPFVAFIRQEDRFPSRMRTVRLARELEGR